MNSFHCKKIAERKRVCFRLREQRVALGVDLKTVSKKTKIDMRYLEALEACAFDELPESPVYHRHFIKAYLKALGIAPGPYIKQYMLEEVASQDEDTTPQRPMGRRYFHNMPQLVRYAFVSIIALTIVGYLGLQVQHILEPPKLTVTNPPDGFITQNQSLTIQGDTEPEVQIAVNGKQIPSDQHGRFEQAIDLRNGVNTIIITATKKHGKTTEQTRHVIYRNIDALSRR